MSTHLQSTRPSAVRSPSTTGAVLPRRPSTGNIAPSQSSERVRRGSNGLLTSGPRTSMAQSSGMRSGPGVAAPQSSMPSAMQNTRRPISNSTTTNSPSAGRSVGAGASNINSLQKVPSSSAINGVGTVRPVGNAPVAPNRVSRSISSAADGSRNMPYNNNVGTTPGGIGPRSAATNPNNVTRPGEPMNRPVGGMVNAPVNNTTEMMNNGMRPDLSTGGQPSIGNMMGRSNSLYGSSLSRNDSFPGNVANKDMYGVQSGFGSMGIPNPSVNGAYMMPNNQGSGYGGFGQGEPSNMSRGSQIGSAFGSMGPSGFGSAARGGSMYGMGSNYGSMYGTGANMNGMNGSNVGPMSGFGSMYGANGNAPPFGSMYGGYGSMYGGVGGPMMMPGSMYGPYGSMYGMGGSMYGNEMSGRTPSSMMMMMPYGGNSLYGGMMPNGMGSMYGIPTYHSVIDVASRRDSFLAQNDLLRADVKPLRSKDEKKSDSISDKKDAEKETKKDASSHTGKGDAKDGASENKEKAKSTSTSGKNQITVESKRDTKESDAKNTTSTNAKNDTTTLSKSEKATSSSTAISQNNIKGSNTTSPTTTSTTTTTTTADSKDNKEVKETTDASKNANEPDKTTNSAEITKNQNVNASNEQSAGKTSTSTTTTATTGATSANATSETATADATASNHNIRGAVLITNTQANKKTTIKKNATTLTINDKSREVDEVVEVDDVNKMAESKTLTELQRTFMQGHKCGLLLGCGKRQRDNLITITKTFLTSCVKVLNELEDVKFTLFVNAAALKGADDGKDLLNKDASYGKLQQASSPVFGPTLNDLVEREVTTESQMSELIAEAMKNSTNEKEMVCFHIVLRLIKNASKSDASVYLSAMTVAIAGEEVKHFTEIKAKSSSEPVRLFRYVVGGSCLTLCAVLISADDVTASNVIDVVDSMRLVKNSEPRSGNVKRFADFTRKEIPINKEKMQSTTNESRKASYATMISRMELMLKDAEDMLAHPESTKPKAYV